MDLESSRAVLNDATKKMQNAETFEEVVLAFEQYNQEYIKLSTRFGKLFLAVYQNVLDQDAAIAYSQEAGPLSDMQQYPPFAKAVEESKFYDEIAERYGPQAIKTLCRAHEINQFSMDNGDAYPDTTEETQAYQTLAVTVAEDYMSKEAEFDSILQKIVKKNHRLAKLMHYDNYRDASNIIYSRFGYSEKEIAWLCDEIRTKVVPYYADFEKRFEEIISADDPGAVNLFKGLRNMMTKLGKETGEFFAKLDEGGYIDAEPSPQKIPNMGLQRFLEEENIGKLITNPVGNYSDVFVLAHEFGHLFQGYLSFNNNELAINVLSSVDMMEIASRTLELLAIFFANEFYHDEKQCKILEISQLLKSTICFSMGTAYENWLYTNVDASVAERKEKYVEIYRSYYPDTKKTDREIISEMYGDSLLYMWPKYQFSYILAWFHAAELAVQYIDHPQEVYDKYIAICKKLAFWEYPEFVKQFDLHNVFEDGSLEGFLGNIRILEDI